MGGDNTKYPLGGADTLDASESDGLGVIQQGYLPSLIVITSCILKILQEKNRTNTIINAVFSTKAIGRHCFKNLYRKCPFRTKWQYSTYL